MGEILFTESYRFHVERAELESIIFYSFLLSHRSAYSLRSISRENIVYVAFVLGLLGILGKGVK